MDSKTFRKGASTSIQEERAEMLSALGSVDLVVLLLAMEKETD
jgi:hypothetical protein